MENAFVNAKNYFQSLNRFAHIVSIYVTSIETNFHDIILIHFIHLDKLYILHIL